MSEQEILQFSRQILLREVGGGGQERLLAATIRIVGWGAGQAAAATYLRCGGTSIDTGQQGGSLGEMPAEFAGATPWVAMGQLGRVARIVVRGSEGCADCFRAAVHGMEGPLVPGWAGLVGIAAALGAQRALLGLETGVEVVEIDRDGALRHPTHARCRAHA